MRPLTVLLPVEEALSILLDAVHPVEETEEVRLTEAVGRVLAESVTSPHDVPPFDRAAMDGFALRAADATQVPAALDCIEYLYAGAPGVCEVVSGTCSEIATGAPVPPGADAVVMVEQTTRAGPHGAERIEVLHAVRPGQHITRRGSDICAGEQVLAAGTLLTPARVGALAAVGRCSARVYRRPRIAVGATGNEIVPPGGPVAPGQIYDVNSYALHALFTSLGCEVEMLEHAIDDVAVIESRIRAGLHCDMVVLSGGSSVGEKDVLQDAFAHLGDILFHGIAIKPGKPTMLARIQGCPVVGMPGYPTSCLSNGYWFLAPAIDRIARRPPSRKTTVRARLTDGIASMADKHHLYTVRLCEGEAAAAFKESGAITSMSRADGFVTIPVGVSGRAAGEEVEVTLL
ncbi:MAG: molybdopterin molybdenumtransferase MoeA [Proteobacteria bacterium]|nr:molybdopterin molybdenumtransferase MoeA [Pseudomonadota bacterium]